ncbi:MAG: chemotaxis protein CheY [Armatimonadetes bacterium]|jgi:CheY-like chemotaxis protein|nr:chemotaxis protein CheY [Armatimonadota bacterium]
MVLHAQLSDWRLSAGEGPGPGPSEGDRSQPERLSRRLGGAVLIIEDDEAIRETLADILQYEGYSVITACDGRDALLRLYGGAPPALILLDLMMPRMNGWEFRAEQLQAAELASIPVVVLSGAHDGRRQAVLLSATGFIPKPIEVIRLLEVVRHHCG